MESKDVVARNLRIAQAALDDPEIDHARALFDYGRTLVESDQPRLGLAPLREAADSTTRATVRRSALKTIFEVHLAYGELAEASAVVEEIRRGLDQDGRR